MQVETQHGFLGIRYVFHDGYAEIDSVIPNTPADMIDLHPGDHVLYPYTGRPDADRLTDGLRRAGVPD